MVDKLGQSDVEMRHNAGKHKLDVDCLLQFQVEERHNEVCDRLNEKHCWNSERHNKSMAFFSKD